MLALIAALVLTPLLYIPGYLIAAALLGAAQPPDPLARHYERVAAGALLNGWLALTLAELGLFSAPLHLALLALVCAGCALAGRRRGALRGPAGRLGLTRSLGRSAVDTNLETGRQGAQSARPRVSRSPGLLALAASHWETIAFAAVGLLFALLVARPFEVVLGARDAGVYASAGFAIARTGGIVQRDDLLAQIAEDQRSPDPQISAAAAQAETNLLGIQDASRFVATRMRFAGFLINAGDLPAGRVTPQFLHLYPAWIGLLASLLGLRGGLLATGLMGLLGVWGVGMLGRRLAGRWVGLLGMLLLALNGVQVWFSRYSTSEAAAQFLSFAALYFFAVMQDSLADAGARRPSARASFAGLLAGVAAGQLVLTRIDFFILVLPLLAYLLYSALTRRWARAHWALAGGLGALAAHAALHVVFISRAYFLDTLYARLQDQSAIVAGLAYLLWTPALRQQFLAIPRAAALRSPTRLATELVLLVALAAALVLLARDGRPQRWLERLLLRRRRALLGLAAAVVLALGAYGYLIRPQILTAGRLAAAPGCLADRGAPDCLALQGYVGAPIAPPAHPNALAYALNILPQLLRARPAAAATVAASADADLREAPVSGAVLSHIRAGAPLDLLGKDSHNRGFAVQDDRGVLGWVISTTLTIDQPTVAALPVLADSVVARVGNPRDVTSFSFGNLGESEKIGIAQANLVRVGWYLSPLGVLLAIAGCALWCWRGLGRSSWLFLLTGLASTLFFVRLTYGTSDLTYIYILRRYVPLAYPAMSLAIAYAIVALAGVGTFKRSNVQTFRYVLAIACAAVLVSFFAFTNRALYRHVEYDGALGQLGALAGQFQPGDVLLFRGEGRDTPDLVTTPLKYAFGIDAFAIRSPDPGKYAAELARYVQRWQAQGRRVFLVLGANGGVALPGLRPALVGPASLRLPEFQQLRDQKPSLPQEFVFDFAVYRLDPAGAPAAPQDVAVDDYTAQLRGFYHPEQIDGATLAWTSGDALLRLPWPRGGAPLALTVRLAPGLARPASLGPARACLSYRAEPTFELLADPPFAGEQCFELSGAGMAGYRYVIDPRGAPAPASGTLLLRIASPATWVPAAADPALRDQRQLGVQFGGVGVP